MIYRLALMTVLVSLAYVPIVAAGDPPLPRTPIGPPSLEMLPDARNPLENSQRQLPQMQPLGADSIRIKNVGNQQLFIAYRDGDSDWRNLAIGAGLTADVSCPKCAGLITIAFHNGKENTSVRIKGGSIYLLGWSAPAQAWVLTPSANQ